MVDSRTAAECKARFRKLSKEVKVRKEKERLLRQQQQLNSTEIGEAGATEVLGAKADRLMQLHANARTSALADNDVDTAPDEESLGCKPSAVSEESKGNDDAGPDASMCKPKKLKPSERRALKKAEKAARLEARARQRAAAVAAADSGSDGEEGRAATGAGATTGGIGWGVVEL